MSTASVSVQVPGGLPVALLILAGLLVLSALSVRSLQVTGRRRGALIGLRWLTALLLALLVAQPTWRVERTEVMAGRVAVLFDDSASLAWGSAGDRRIDAAQTLLDRLRSESRGLPGRVRFYRVSDGLTPLDPTRPASETLTGGGTQSRLHAALEEALELPFEPTSVVLVSDGADTTQKPLPKDLGVPVHTVGFRDDPPLRDDAVVEVEPDARVYLHTRAHVLVEVQSVGLGSRDLTVRLEREGELIDQESVHLQEGDSSHVQLDFMPRELGRQSYRVRIEPDDNDMIAANDSLPFVVEVVRERLRVLHVAGAPSWDQRFLRGFLKRDPALDLISFFILRSTHDMTMSNSSELALIPFPTDELFREHLSSFDVVILQNFNYAPYRMARYLPLIRDYVRNGGALAMIGGPLSFDGGGYSDTPIAEVLPVELMPQPTGSARAIPGEFVPRRSRTHRHHPLLDLHPDPAAAARAWAGLQPLEGAHQFAGLSKHGTALWTHPEARVGGRPMPVLAVGQFGRGRTLALGTDTVWHWTVPTAGRGGDPTVYDRFWDRALRWLARDPALAPSQLATDLERYGPGDTVTLKALVRGPDYTPRSEAEVRVRRFGEREGEPLRVVPLVVDPRSEAEISFRAPEASGLYVLELSGEGVAPQSEPFLVIEGGAELADPRVREEGLEALAARTGGRALAQPADVPALSDLLTPTEVRAGVERHAPFASWWVGLVALAVFCLEWWLRRAWGER